MTDVEAACATNHCFPIRAAQRQPPQTGALRAARKALCFKLEMWRNKILDRVVHFPAIAANSLVRDVEA